MNSPAPRNILRHLLLDELQRRQAKNSAYSLRAFARDLRIAPSDLSKVMRGHLYLSLRSAHKLLVHLGLEPTEMRARMVELSLEYVDWLLSQQEQLAPAAPSDSVADEAT